MGFKKLNKGFTLIELLVVIGILAILLAITLVAINPAKQIGQANDTKRKADVKVILDAVGQYVAGQGGLLPLGLDGTTKQIAAPAGPTSVDLCFQLVTRYVAAFPVDPSINGGKPISPCTGTYSTGYYIVVTGPDNRVKVTAPNAEMGIPIEVIR